MATKTSNRIVIEVENEEDKKMLLKMARKMGFKAKAEVDEDAALKSAIDEGMKDKTAVPMSEIFDILKD